MGFFDRFKRNTIPHKEEANDTNISIKEESSNISNIDMTLDTSNEEKELVSLIASAIASGDHPDAKFKVTSVKRIDTEKEIAAAIVSAIASGDNPNSDFILRSITEVK